MYESPITQILSDISSQVREAQDGRLIYEVQQAIGYEIDKEELLRALRYDRDQYQKGYKDGCKGNEWIPVSERLPDDRRVVEVTAYWHETYQTMQGVYFGSSYFYSDGEWWCVPFNNTGEHMQRLDVIAWKELSKPYKEVSE